MATEAAIGHGTLYYIGTAAGATPGAFPGSYTKISEVIEVTPGSPVADRIDATHMESPSRRREYVSGLIENGEGSFVINWVPGSATDVFLRGLMDSGDMHLHRIVFPNGVSVEFEATILGFEKGVPIDDRMTATLTVNVSGDETWDDTP